MIIKGERRVQNGNAYDNLTMILTQIDGAVDSHGCSRIRALSDSVLSTGGKQDIFTTTYYRNEAALAGLVLHTRGTTEDGKSQALSEIIDVLDVQRITGEGVTMGI